MRTGHPFYWAITGMMIGFGLISFDIVFLSYPFLLIGLGMAIYGFTRPGSRGLWAAFIGLGAVPAFFLIMDIATAPPSCPTGGLVLPPHTASVTCGSMPTSYYILAAIFIAITLAGAAWPLLRRHARG